MRVLADPAEEAVHKRPEDLERRGSEGGPKQGQDRAERRCQDGIGGDLLEGALDTSLVRASRRCSLPYPTLDVDGRSPSNRPEVKKVKLS